MNIFRLAGDMTHLASVLVLLLKIHTIKSCAGISLKTQELYAIVFASRYLDIFTTYISFYNTVMKLIFLGSSFSIVWYMRRHKVVRRSYDKDQDTFRHYILMLPCLILALIINERFTFREVMWTFSLYLEAVAILPQLVLLQRTRNVDNLTGQYIFLLGAYRGLYILNWVYRYFTENHYVHWITWVAGAFSTVAAVEGIHQIKKNKLVSLSEQELVDCDTTQNQGCNGGLMDLAFEYVKKNGLTTEEDYPYQATQGTCHAKKEQEGSSVVTVDGHENVPANNEDALLKAVAHQPVSVAIDAEGSAFQFYKEGVFTGHCGTDLDHGVVAVGYGTTRDGTKYWIVRNSWGADWGEEGYIRLERGISERQGMCGIAMEASYPIIDQSNNSVEGSSAAYIKDEL